MPKQQKDRQTVALEEMQDKFRAFGDGLKVVLDRTERIDQRLDKMDQGIDNLETIVSETAQNTLEIKHLLSQKVDIEDFQILEKKFVALEQFVHTKLGVK